MKRCLTSEKELAQDPIEREGSINGRVIDVTRHTSIVERLHIFIEAGDVVVPNPLGLRGQWFFFLKPLETHRDKTGLLIFEFSRFSRRDYQVGRDFIDDLDGYSTGDVLIAKLVDMDGDKLPSRDDKIRMGRYPTSLNAGSFGDWQDTAHVIQSDFFSMGVLSVVHTDTPAYHSWYRGADGEYYAEQRGSGASIINDGFAGGGVDRVFERVEPPLDLEAGLLEHDVNLRSVG